LSGSGRAAGEVFYVIFLVNPSIDPIFPDFVRDTSFYGSRFSTETSRMVPCSSTLLIAGIIGKNSKYLREIF
jgi:hypothetical protein